MGRNIVVVISAIAVAMLSAAGLYLVQHHSKPLPTETDELNDTPRPSEHVARGDFRTAGRIPSATSISTTAPRLSLADTDAATAYELVEINLRCQIDREASASGDHVRSTDDELCKDLSLEPLTREEVFQAITYAAEHGSIPAQLNYSLYASRIFENEQNSLDPDLIQEYKMNTVRFLESAGIAGEPQAYIRLSDIYKNGALASKDPVMAYAYAEAYFRTGSNHYKASFLNNATSGLDGAQLHRGKEIAAQILSKRNVSK